MPKLVGSIFGSAGHGDPVESAWRRHLDMALRMPVTITRNDQDFALLRRELVAQLSAVTDKASMFLDALGAIQSVRSGNVLRDDHPHHWLNGFEVTGGDRVYYVPNPDDEQIGLLCETATGRALPDTPAQHGPIG